MDDETKKIIEEQFAKLPKQVREAIQSTKMAEQFQALVKKHGLHVDQWDQLENQIMLTVLGLAEPEELTDFAVKEIGIEQKIAEAVIDDVAVTIFKPIREEMERQLGSPEAKDEQVSDVEKLRDSVLGEAKTDGSIAASNAVGAPVQSAETTSATPLTTTPTAPPAAIVPGTPPAPPPTAKAERAPISASYTAQKPSTERKGVQDDPYREQVA